MKSMRYIVTRPCLQEGSLRLLKYLESSFPQSGPATFVDDKGEEHTVQIDVERGRVWGLGSLYHAQNLGVNDVLVLTGLAPARYQVEAVVKPHAPPPAPRSEVRHPPETRRVVVSSTPHVREVRQQVVRTDTVRSELTDLTDKKTPEKVEPRRLPSLERPGAERAAERATERSADTEVKAEVKAAAPQTAQLGQAGQLGRTLDVRFHDGEPTSFGPVLNALYGTPSNFPVQSVPVQSVAAKPVPTRPARPVAAPLAAIPAEAEAQLGELARLTGYRLEELGGGISRLKAELGTHAYSVLIASHPDGLRQPGWQEEADYRLLLTTEQERPAGVSRLTREALVALIEHARLAPLSPVDLRGYWKAGSVDLESAASVAELVSSHLAQRGAFSFVLLTLAQQPAHSVISVPRLAERLGSGVNFAELGSILDTLTRAPFLALTPLPGGQYLLRVGVSDLLTDMAEYADGVRRRVRTPAQRDNVMV